MSSKKGVSVDGWGGKIILIIITVALTTGANLIFSPFPIFFQTDGGLIIMSRSDISDLYEERENLQSEIEHYRALYTSVNVQLNELRQDFEHSQGELTAFNDGRVLQARSHIEESNYQAAIQLLNAIPSAPPEVIILLQEATLMYELQIIAQVNNLLLNRQIDDAANLTREAQRFLPNSRNLRELLDDVESRVARSGPLNVIAPLYDRVAWTSHQVQHQDSAVMSGETFRDVLVLRRLGAGSTFNPASLHNLSRQHTRLYGYFGRVDGTSLRHATFNFWGDGVLLDYFEFNATDVPTPFSVNVEGVQQLRIEVVIGGGSSDSTPSYAIQAFLE